MGVQKVPKPKFKNRTVKDMFERRDIDGLVYWLTPGNPDRADCATALGFLGKYGDTYQIIEAGAIPILVGFLDDPYAKVRNEAAGALISIGNVMPFALYDHIDALLGHKKTNLMGKKVQIKKSEVYSSVKQKEQEKKLELARGYEKAMNYSKALEIYDELGDRDKAIELLGEKMGKWGKIAEIHLYEGNDVEAANVYGEKLGNWEMAAEIYEELKMWDQAKECREKLVPSSAEVDEKRVRKPYRKMTETKVEMLYGALEEKDEYKWGDLFSYNIVKKIGGGGFSEVYIVERNGKEYAMKVPRGIDVSGDETIEMRMEDNEKYSREARIWAMLTENEPDTVVNLVDAGVVPFPWFVMELADSGLMDIMYELPFNEKIGIISDLLFKLDRIHHYSVIHKDIKPENILKVGDVWKFSDFGLSRSISTVSMASTVLSGTMVYMAPEQISKKLGTTDWRTDIWQMGVLIYELLTYRRPFEGDDVMEISMSILHNDPTTGTDHNLNEQVWNIIKRSLDKNKTERWQSAAQLADALKSLKSN